MKLGLVLGMLLATGTLATLATPLASADDPASVSSSPAIYKLCIGADTTKCFGAYWEDSNLTHWCVGVYDRSTSKCTGLEIPHVVE